MAAQKLNSPLFVLCHTKNDKNKINKQQKHHCTASMDDYLISPSQSISFARNKSEYFLDIKNQ
jgi:hypothetical protein